MKKGISPLIAGIVISLVVLSSLVGIFVFGIGKEIFTKKERTVYAPTEAGLTKFIIPQELMKGEGDCVEGSFCYGGNTQVYLNGDCSIGYSSECGNCAESEGEVSCDSQYGQRICTDQCLIGKYACGKGSIYKCASKEECKIWQLYSKCPEGTECQSGTGLAACVGIPSSTACSPDDPKSLSCKGTQTQVMSYCSSGEWKTTETACPAGTECLEGGCVSTGEDCGRKGGDSYCRQTYGSSYSCNIDSGLCTTGTITPSTPITPVCTKYYTSDWGYCNKGIQGRTWSDNCGNSGVEQKPCTTVPIPTCSSPNTLYCRNNKGYVCDSSNQETQLIDCGANVCMMTQSASGAMTPSCKSSEYSQLSSCSPINTFFCENNIGYQCDRNGKKVEIVPCGSGRTCVISGGVPDCITTTTTTPPTYTAPAIKPACPTCSVFFGITNPICSASNLLKRSLGLCV